MKIVVDEKKVKRQAMIGRIALFGSLAVLMGGLALTLFGPQLGLFNPENIGLFYLLYTVILIVGFGVSRIGMYYGNRYLSPSRPSQILRESLKGLERKYALMLFTLPAEYVLVEPGGITVFVVKTQSGRVTYKGGKWKRKENILSLWFGREEPLGDPGLEAVEAQQAIAKILAEKAPNLKIPLRAVIVFTHPKVELDVEPGPTAVVRAGELKDFLRGAGKWKELPNSIQRQMRAALGAPELPAPEKSAESGR
ncbi:MAG: hypothetical protein RMN25_13355 [Anaerolineae bacterium]|nr:hypothetical protein [Thermoflexales bacterium]MDW8408761.1 hypothetical protein [Anaerolineae bacterium]